MVFLVPEKRTFFSFSAWFFILQSVSLLINTKMKTCGFKSFELKPKATHFTHTTKTINQKQIIGIPCYKISYGFTTKKAP